MARKPHLRGEQLKLFMTAHELKNSLSDSVDLQPSYIDYDDEGNTIQVPDQTMDDLWEQKLDESKYKPRAQSSSLYDSIAQRGVRKHVTLVPDGKGGLTMGQGHHRVAAAADIAEKTGRQMYIPVIYDDDFQYSDTEEYKDMYPQNLYPGGWDDDAI
jgi:hypothetical protein